MIEYLENIIKELKENQKKIRTDVKVMQKKGFYQLPEKLIKECDIYDINEREDIIDFVMDVKTPSIIIDDIIYIIDNFITHKQRR